jgi:hypothetical protein
LCGGSFLQASSEPLHLARVRIDFTEAAIEPADLCTTDEFEAIGWKPPRPSPQPLTRARRHRCQTLMANWDA